MEFFLSYIYLLWVMLIYVQFFIWNRCICILLYALKASPLFYKCTESIQFYRVEMISPLDFLRSSAIVNTCFYTPISVLKYTYEKSVVTFTEMVLVCISIINILFSMILVYGTSWFEHAVFKCSTTTIVAVLFYLDVFYLF